MLKRLIEGSLEHRVLVLVLAAGLLTAGGVELVKRPVDIFPDLNQPVVTVLAEAPGLAPEEVEALVVRPIEAAMAGAPGVERMRAIAKDGLAIVRADFGWQTDVYLNRQLVQERLQLAAADLPTGVVPEMAPASSLTGQVMDLGLTSPDGSVSSLELQSLAEWTLRRRLMAVPGVSQVVVIGGLRKQYQVLVEPDQLIHHGVSLAQVSGALARASANTPGGYLVAGPREMLVRNLGRLSSVEEIDRVVVRPGPARPVRVRDLASVTLGGAYPRGAANVGGKPGVVLEVFKQPEADTLALTLALDRELKHLRASLPSGVAVWDDLYRQSTFLDRGVDNVIEALWIGAVLVVLVLLLFLFDVRASLVSLTALPLSFATAGLFFWLFDMSLNTMTLGGLAIAVGELVDDAIVGVENVVRWLRNRSPDADGGPEAFTCLVADATSEVRGPILSGTLIVVLVFVPLFALSGIEGRLFSPLALAYVVTLLASMVVSLTVTPVLALLLFRGLGTGPLSKGRTDSPVLRWSKVWAGRAIAWAVRRRAWVLGGTTALVLGGAGLATGLGNTFLPEFDEGTAMVMVRLPPGTSLAESDRLAGLIQYRLDDLPGVRRGYRFSGRGEHDEHAATVNISHVMLTLDPEVHSDRQALLAAIRERLAGLEGLGLSVGQPLAHRIDHLLTGVQAQIVLKVNGPDLPVLRRAALQVAEVAGRVPGVTDLFVEPQVRVPQVHVRMRPERLSELGLTPGELAQDLKVAIGGDVVGTIFEQERTYDLFVRLAKQPRASIVQLKQLPIRLPGGGWARLGELAQVEEGVGPSDIRRDQLVRRVAVSANAQGRSVGEVVADLERALAPLEAGFPDGTFLSYEGQFTAQLEAARTIGLLSLLSLAAILIILFSQFRSFNLALQVLVSLPTAFLGGVGLLWLTGQPFSVSALVGFVSLAGIASRNGILLVSTYLQLLSRRAENVTVELLIEAGRTRAAPVIMTALTTGVGLLPLLLAGGQAGREILYPVATVVIGGLLTSTAFEFLLRPALFWWLGRGAAERVAHRVRAC